MIEANKKLIKANLTQGVAGVQFNVVTLYQGNLAAISTQAALIAGFAFTAVSNINLNQENQTLSYFYFTLFTICLVAALIVLTQATVVMMFGPSLALKGGDQSSVKIASDLMRGELWFVLIFGLTSISALFAGACFLSWAIYPGNIAAVCTVVYVIGYLILVKEGFRAYLLFVPADDVTLDNHTNIVNGAGPGGQIKGVGNGTGGVRMTDVEFQQKIQADLAAANEKKRMKYKGVIWLRQAAEYGGLFTRVYGVLKHAKLDFYKNEQEFLSQGNPINANPVKLWSVDLETDSRKFTQEVTSLSNVMKATVMGDDSRDFTMKDLMASNYDLPYAAKHFRFALIPKISSELESVDTVELLAHDEESYKTWVHSLGSVISGCEEVEDAQTVEDSIRTGQMSVNAVVRTANQ